MDLDDLISVGQSVVLEILRKTSPRLPDRRGVDRLVDRVRGRTKLDFLPSRNPGHGRQFKKRYTRETVKAAR